MSAPKPTAPNIKPSASAPLLCTLAAKIGIKVMYGIPMKPTTPNKIKRSRMGVVARV